MKNIVYYNLLYNFVSNLQINARERYMNVTKKVVRKSCIYSTEVHLGRSHLFMRAQC
jgi:hypothetical protein